IEGPNFAGETIPQLHRRTYTPLGLVETRTEPVDPGPNEMDSIGRITRYKYDTLDPTNLVAIEQLTSIIPGVGTSVYSTLASFGPYDTKHRPSSMTDAAGKTWLYGYNTWGQLESVKDPLGRETKYNHDTQGRLTTVVNANNQTVLTLAYPSTCQGVNCDL